MSLRSFQWTNPSVLKMAEGQDPVSAISELAQQLVRRAMDAGWSGPPFDPIQLADLLHIQLDARDDVRDARVVPIGQSRFRIEFNPNQSRFRVRFSLAHELAHTLFPDCSMAVRNRASRGEQKADDWQLEMLCNVGAAEILMPAGAERIPIDKLSAATLVDLQKKYEVSTEALLIRIAKTSELQCAAFCASQSNGNARGKPEFSIDYLVQSPSSEMPFGPGFRIPEESVVRTCTAIGYTASAEEEWLRHPLHIECIALPSYPGTIFPRVAGLLMARLPNSKSPAFFSEIMGDATSPVGGGERFIAHIVNDVTENWGGHGFAKDLAKRFPMAQEEFRRWVQGGRSERLRLGNIHLAKAEPGITVISMIAQKGYGKETKRRLRYAALQGCLESLAKEAFLAGATVHAPLIGTGQAGGSWEVVKDMLLEIVCSRRVPVTIYHLLGHSHRSVSQLSLGLPISSD
jgi:IrrE N-terminal-like domain